MFPFVTKDIVEEIKQLHQRINELERLISQAFAPLQNAQQITKRYLTLVQLAFEHGGLTPEMVLPAVQDPISRDIVRVIMDHTDQNLFQITDLV
ncbi:MAG: hypothetical protein QXL17_06165 [Candidatus Thermoplasmatota archaeon]